MTEKYDYARYQRMRELSELTVRRLNDLLTECFPEDLDKVQECMSELERAKSETLDPLIPGDPKTMVGRYQRVLRAIEPLRAALLDFGIEESETLNDLIEGFESDPLLAKFDMSAGQPASMYGVTSWEIRERLDVLERTIQHALERIKVRRGAKPKTQERSLAVTVKEILEDNEIQPTTYDDGIYFKILEVMFEECFENAGEHSHRRHGEYALKYGDSDFHDIWYLPPGSLDT